MSSAQMYYRTLSSDAALQEQKQAAADSVSAMLETNAGTTATRLESQNFYKQSIDIAGARTTLDAALTTRPSAQTLKDQGLMMPPTTHFEREFVKRQLDRALGTYICTRTPF